MLVKERADGVELAPAHAALGGEPKQRNDLRRCGDTAAGALPTRWAPRTSAIGFPSVDLPWLTCPVSVEWPD